MPSLASNFSILPLISNIFSPCSSRAVSSHAASPPNVSAYLSARVARRSSCAASTRAETRSVAIRRCASASSTKSRAASAGQALATRWYAVSASTLFTNSACASERAEISPACASNAAAPLAALRVKSSRRRSRCSTKRACPASAAASRATDAASTEATASRSSRSRVAENASRSFASSAACFANSSSARWSCWTDRGGKSGRARGGLSATRFEKTGRGRSDGRATRGSTRGYGGRSRSR